YGPALLVLLRGVLQQRQRVEADVYRDERAESRLAAFDLLAGERLGDEVESRAAVSLRDDDAEDSEFGYPRDRIAVEAVRDVVFDGVRQDPLVDEGANGVLQQALLVGELEVHDGLVYGRLGRCRPHHLGHLVEPDAAAESGDRRRLRIAVATRCGRRDRGTVESERVETGRRSRGHRPGRRGCEELSGVAATYGRVRRAQQGGRVRIGTGEGSRGYTSAADGARAIRVLVPLARPACWTRTSLACCGSGRRLTDESIKLP